MREFNEKLKEVKGPLYEAKGVLRYSENFRLVVEVDEELSNYYRSLIPKWKPIQRQKYTPHVTVVRGRGDRPPNPEHWEKYQDEEIKFLYSPDVQEGSVYYWLNVFSTRLEEIRGELGLPIHDEYTQPPEGFVKCFHMTLGNKKESQG